MFQGGVEHGAVVAQHLRENRGGGGAEHVVIFNGLIAPQIANRHDDIAGKVRMGAGTDLSLCGDGHAGHGLDDGILIGTILGRAGGAALIGDQGPGSGDGPGQGRDHVGHVLGYHAARHEHGRVGLGTVGVSTGNTVVLLADGNDLVPHPFHINAAQNPDAEQDAADIVSNDGMVEDFFAAHGFNGHDVRVLGAFFKALQDLHGVITFPHVVHIRLAQIRGGWIDKRL